MKKIIILLFIVGFIKSQAQQCGVYGLEITPSIPFENQNIKIIMVSIADYGYCTPPPPYHPWIFEYEIFENEIILRQIVSPVVIFCACGIYDTVDIGPLKEGLYKIKAYYIQRFSDVPPIRIDSLICYFYVNNIRWHNIENKPFFLYYNKENESLYLNVSDSFTSIDLEIYDISMRRVYCEYNINRSISIFLKRSGVYIIKFVINKKEIFIEKFVFM